MPKDWPAAHLHLTGSRATLPREAIAMSNLTISVDEDLIRKARVRAIQEGTSVSTKLREYLQLYVNGASDMQAHQRQDATDALLAAIEAARLQAQPDPLPPDGQGQTLRDNLYSGDFRAQARATPKGP